MKKCPACDKEFPDSMRFCQTDGTLLVEKIEDTPDDPYKTVVGNQSYIASAMPPLDPFKTMVASPPPAPPKSEEDLLQLPDELDSLKTMVVSHEELKAELQADKTDESSPLDLPSDLPPTGQYAPSAPLIQPKPKPVSVPPLTAEPKVESPFAAPPAAPPNFGNISAPKPEEDASSAATAIIDNIDVPPNPPPPFESKPFENDFSGKSPYGNQDSKPIPSPFDLSMPPGYLPPSMNPFDAPKPPPVKDFAEPNQPNPFDAAATPFGQAEPFNQPIQQTEWTAPPAPDANWQNQELGANTPFQPPVAGQGLNQTLPIISLVLGILSVCCYVSPLTGIAALVTGYLGMKNVNTDPNQYGGKTLAIVGMILGGLFFLIGAAYWILIIVLGASGSLMRGI